ncbi:Pantothenate kinase, partial [Haemophilus influenzae]
NVRILVNV